MAGDLVRSVHGASRMTRRVRRRTAELKVSGSFFCGVRDRPTAPLCGFYLAATLEVLERFGLHAAGHVAGCRAIDGPRCVLSLDWSGSREAQTPAVAA